MDRHNFDERFTRKLEWRRPDARTTLDGRHPCAGWPRHSAAHQRQQLVDVCTAGAAAPIQSSSHGSTINCMPGTAPARHQAPSSVRLTGVGRLTTPRSFTNNADTGPAGRPPHPATRASLPDTGAWTIAHNCPISQVYTPTALISPRVPVPALNSRPALKSP